MLSLRLFIPLNMNSKELRIGNFILSDKEIVEINFLTPFSIGFGKGNFAPNDSILANFKSINLNEEWLLKLGFKEISFTQDRNRDWYKMFEIDDTSEVLSLNYYTKTNYCRFNFDIGYGNKYVDLYYVHQLQNLYFDLSGIELSTTTKAE